MYLDQPSMHIDYRSNIDQSYSYGYNTRDLQTVEMNTRYCIIDMDQIACILRYIYVFLFMSLHVKIMCIYIYIFMTWMSMFPKT